MKMGPKFKKKDAKVDKNCPPPQDLGHIRDN